MIKLSRQLSHHLAPYLIKKISKYSIVDASFLHNDKGALIGAFHQALNVAANKPLLLARLVRDTPRNKPDYLQFWLIRAEDVQTELASDDNSGFSLLDLQDDWVVSPDLGPDHKGGFELTVSETEPLHLVARLQTILKSISL